ncbi:MAG TPA: alpha/beta hydrolase [Woeseiaceae bacterium]|nr:alpha/beta hydrolase [Woeseiaceae bacterium]
MATQTAPLYLLPGLMCDERIWASQVVALAAYAPVAVSGYGDARSLEVMARRVLASAPERISVAGHSMGGRVALEICRLAPERVERIALLDTGVHPVGKGEREKRMALLDLGRRNGIEALVDAWLPPMLHPDRRQDVEFVAPLREMCVRGGLARYENQVTALLERQDASSLLAAIHCPALIGVGSDDLWASVGQHRAMAAAIAGAELVIFAHAGHMTPAEAPDEVTAALRDWLELPP